MSAAIARTLGKVWAHYAAREFREECLMRSQSSWSRGGLRFTVKVERLP